MFIQNGGISQQAMELITRWYPNYYPIMIPILSIIIPLLSHHDPNYDSILNKLFLIVTLAYYYYIYIFMNYHSQKSHG